MTALAPRRVYFLGASASSSSVVRRFPAWSEALGLDAELAPIDVPIGADSSRLARFVDQLVDDPRAIGAVVTTHKVGLWRAAGDRFSRADASVERLGEVACITREQDGVLVAHTIDPVSCVAALSEMVAAGHWEGRGADAVVLGAGGAGTAIVDALFAGDAVPATVVLTDVEPARLEEVEAIGRRSGWPARLELTTVRGPDDGDAIVSCARPGSLVVNATGMGKDVPGSPLSSAARFPRSGMAWELNYRGARPFLQLAQTQRTALGLGVHDGARLFALGWAEGLRSIFGRAIDADRLSPGPDPPNTSIG